MRFTFLSRLCLLTALALPAAANDSRTLVLHEDFSGDQLDRNVWHVIEGNGCPAHCGFGNNELQTYTGSAENLRLENGHLVIEAHAGETVTSAKITTEKATGWQYGRIEMRAKLPEGLGTWPAFWMMPKKSTYGSWPKSGEIDIMEHVGFDPGVVHGTVHTQAFNHRIGTQKGGQVSVPTAMQGFHEYAIEWDENAIHWYLDGEKFFTFDRLEDATSAEWPFDQPFYIILNLAIGGDWGGSKGVNLDALPARYEVDWVKVWQ
jgi:beta-glucanase (GH16 family)